MSVPLRGTAVHLEPPGPEPVGLGRFGEFGGRFAPETLVPALAELEADFRDAWSDDAFRAEYASLLSSYVGRPTPVTECARLSERLGVRVLLKREDLAHTGSHKINNVLGQCLLTRRMGKQRVIAETGAGQHGVAAATGAALFGLGCTVYMGAVDVERQALNVWRMKLLGADVVPVQSGSATLKDAVNEAMRGWVESVESTHYCIGSAMGPHPFPWMVREFQRVVGDEARAQTRALLDGDDPDFVVACVGGGSNAIGTFTAFVESRRAARRRRGRRARARERSPRRGGEPRRARRRARHALAVPARRVRPGARSDVDQRRASTIPGVGPEHAMLAAQGRAEYYSADRRGGARRLPAARRDRRASCPRSSPRTRSAGSRARPGTSVPTGSTVLVTLSGRGDKDAAQVAERLGEMT